MHLSVLTGCPVGHGMASKDAGMVLGVLFQLLKPGCHCVLPYLVLYYNHQCHTLLRCHKPSFLFAFFSHNARLKHSPTVITLVPHIGNSITTGQKNVKSKFRRNVIALQTSHFQAEQGQDLFLYLPRSSRMCLSHISCPAEPFLLLLLLPGPPCKQIQRNCLLHVCFFSLFFQSITPYCSEAMS